MARETELRLLLLFGLLGFWAANFDPAHVALAKYLATRGVVEASSVAQAAPAAKSASEAKSEHGEKIWLKTTPVFYNLFVKKAKDRPRVERIVAEQMSFLRPEHRVYVHSIGVPLPIPNTSLLKHHSAAWEEVSLYSLWQHCLNHRDENVVYLHSKGSFDSSPHNDWKRLFVTRGALSSAIEALIDANTQRC